MIAGQSFGRDGELDGRQRRIRNAKLARLHAAVHAQGLDDATYRDRLERLTGKRSAKELDEAGLDKALADFTGSNVSRETRHPHHAKVKALWIAAFNLGQVNVGDDAALDAFVYRQAGVQSLTFLAPHQAHRVAEALKAMLARGGCDVPASDADGMQSRRNLVRAQWAKLVSLGSIRVTGEDGIIAYARKKNAVEATKTVDQMKRHELDQLARHLGRWLRAVQAKRKAA